MAADGTDSGTLGRLCRARKESENLQREATGFHNIVTQKARKLSSLLDMFAVQKMAEKGLKAGTENLDFIVCFHGQSRVASHTRMRSSKPSLGSQKPERESEQMGLLSLVNPVNIWGSGVQGGGLFLPSWTVQERRSAIFWGFLPVRKIEH